MDRLLDSEHWGRHWLDVARYGESTGSARNVPYPHAWRYRDYVIDAFNADKSFNEFVREQIAGDLLPAADDAQRREHLVATGFLALGVKDVNQRFKVRFEMDNIDEQIDTVSRSLLALTVSCARCHDHKFDPVSTRDYYALAGIFHSTDLCAGVRSKMGGGGLDYYDTTKLLMLSQGTPANADPAQQERIAAAEKAVAEAKAEFERLRDSPEGAEPGDNGRPKRQIARQKLRKLEGELTMLTDPVAYSEVAFGVRDSKSISDTQVRLRGEAEQLGPVVPRGFPRVLSYEGQPTVPADQSGRLQLADWLVNPQNPLTSRVIANRVWQHLFGAGLVSTVDNFGTTGVAPTHPELLDHLATSLVDQGWSLKRFIRSLVLTRTYQLSSDATDAQLAADPANRWQWRHSPRRLSAEELRDAMLIVGGVLDRTRPAAAVKELPVIEIRNNGPEAQKLIEQARASRNRSVYLPLLRTIVPESLEVFDFAEQGLVTGSRQTTTVAPQALYLLNDRFVRRQALSLARRLIGDATVDSAERVRRAYRSALDREATADEVIRALAYVVDYSALAAQEQPASAVAAVASETPVAAATTDAGKPIAPVAADGANPARDATAKPAKEDAIDPQTAAWASFVQALLASGEFRYVR
ncbi:MAG: DUF1549 and DUF1553 domain-containing protein [Planctomycetaceae bacterium]